MSTLRPASLFTVYSFLGFFSFLVLFSLGTGEVYSKKKKLGVVEEVWGNVFLVEEGKTKQLRAGDYLYDFSEVMTEEGAQVSFSDYYDHQFHLAGSGHIKMMNKIVELVLINLKTKISNVNCVI